MTVTFGVVLKDSRKGKPGKIFPKIIWLWMESYIQATTDIFLGSD